MAIETRTREPAASPAQHSTLPTIFRARCRVNPAGVALREKRFGVWLEHSWSDYYERARAIGMGLVALGLERGDRVAVHSEDRPEWVFTDLGAIGAGATTVGIYPTNPAPEVEYLLSHSGARFLVAEDQEQVDKALAVAGRCPSLERIVVIDAKGLRHYDDPRLITYEEVERLGRSADPVEFERRVDAAQPADIAMIVYTSGTTGPPKGAMLSHANVAHAVRMQGMVWGGTEQDRLLSYLPLCHVAEKLLTIFVPMACGACANFAESIETVQDNLREVEPTIFLGVPRIWEKMAAGVEIRMRDASRVKRANYRLWMRLGKRLARVYVASHGRYPFPWNVAYTAGWLCLYRPIQRKLGLSKVHTPVSGAAPIAPEILWFFHAIGIHVREGWGQTECTGLGSFTPRDDFRVGSIGIPIDGVEIRIAGDGEILLRSPGVFAGYYRNDQATREAVDADGWLHTGDVGAFDDAGHLHISDRKKDILITAGGKNISPSEIENKLKASPYIREAAVVGDARKFLAALVGIERDTVADWAQRKGIAFTTYRDLTEKPEVVDLVDQEVRRVNADLAQVEQVKRFRLIPKELDHEDGELTATQKVKRSVLTERFADLVASMYQA